MQCHDDLFFLSVQKNPLQDGEDTFSRSACLPLPLKLLESIRHTILMLPYARCQQKDRCFFQSLLKAVSLHKSISNPVFISWESPQYSSLISFSIFLKLCLSLKLSQNVHTYLSISIWYPSHLQWPCIQGNPTFQISISMWPCTPSIHSLQNFKVYRLNKIIIIIIIIKVKHLNTISKKERKILGLTQDCQGSQ